jgi:methylenetetrahydrofolate dehydrogenase (NADP+)/methenyltetrahydrofolate cyclohydrolase
VYVKVIDGTAIAKTIEQAIAHAVGSIKTRLPGLAFILVGDTAASRSYVRMKKKKCHEVGILSVDLELTENTTEERLLEEINQLNRDPEIDGILVQLPLPAHISTPRIMQAIAPDKDVDGFHPINMGKLLLGEHDGFISCTPQGILVLLAAAQIPLLGKHVVIIGRSNIVGKPLAALLMQKAPHCNATVTVAHSLTERLAELCFSADILIAAIGSPHFVKPFMVRDGAVVIDVGINRIIGPDGKPHIVGDVDFQTVAPKCAHITPVPGGIGPMTIALLLHNTLLSYQRKMPK